MVGGAKAIVSWRRYGLTRRENGCDLHHCSVHCDPQILVDLCRCDGHRSAAHTVLVGAHVEIYAARMSAEVARVGGVHFAEPADGNRNRSIRGTAKWIVEIDVRNLAKKLLPPSDHIAAATRSDLQVEVPDQIAIRSGCPAFNEERRGLQLVRRW